MTDEKLSNFIPINRKLFEHEFWEERRCFSKFEAWIDLLQSARFDEEEKIDWINNKQVKYKRGQLIASFRFLQKRWNWGSITKVERFLEVLKKKDMVVSEKGQGVNVITICKYESYNKVKKDERTPKGQGRGRQKDETNKENKEDDNKRPLNYLVVEEYLLSLKEWDIVQCKNQSVSFFDHFTSNGWKVSGKAPMQDWKSSVRNWMRRSQERVPSLFSKSVNYDNEQM